MEADPDRLAQAVGNLLHNAAKFTPEGGEVSVTVARDGGRAVVRLRDSGPGIPEELRPEAVILDIGLPGMDGFEVARQFRKRFGPGMVLLALTGYGRDQDRARGLEAGFDHYLLKPVSYDVLEELLAGETPESEAPGSAAAE